MDGIMNEYIYLAFILMGDMNHIVKLGGPAEFHNMNLIIFHGRSNETSTLSLPYLLSILLSCWIQIL